VALKIGQVKKWPSPIIKFRSNFVSPIQSVYSFLRCFQASLGQKSLWTFSKTKYFLSSRLGLKKILDNFYQQEGGTLAKINSKFISRPCMSNNTPIESPSRLDKKYCVFENVHSDFWPIFTYSTRVHLDSTLNHSISCRGLFFMHSVQFRGQTDNIWRSWWWVLPKKSIIYLSSPIKMDSIIRLVWKFSSILKLNRAYKIANSCKIIS
jgi:hypothetical protein